MSYEKLSHISTFKDGRITLTTACNNLTPITYETWELKKLDGETQREAVIRIAKDIIDGNIHPNRSCNLDLYNVWMYESVFVGKVCPSLSKLDYMMYEDYNVLRDTYYSFYNERKDITSEVIADHILSKNKNFPFSEFDHVIPKLKELDSRINDFILEYQNNKETNIQEIENDEEDYER